jgi:transposase
MEKEILGYFLPAGLLEYFTITKVEEIEEASTKSMVIQIEIEEINQIPNGYDSSKYESKGFYPVKLIQDFPIRGKAVYLAIKRRRWRHKENKNEVIENDYTIVAEGSKLTQELSDFLKGTGRDPGRYH